MPESLITGELPHHDFLLSLWEAIGDESRASRYTADLSPTEILQLALIEKHLATWKGLTISLLGQPQKLNYYEPELRIETPSQVSILTNVDRSEETLGLKYSRLRGKAEERGKFTGRIPASIESAYPQLEFDFKEIFTDSNRELNRSIEGLEEMRESLGLGTAERIGKVDELLLNRAELIDRLRYLLKAQVVSELKLVGKAGYHDSKSNRRVFLNLLGMNLLFTDSGRVLNVQQLYSFLGRYFTLPLTEFKLPETPETIFQLLEGDVKRLAQHYRTKVLK